MTSSISSSHAVSSIRGRGRRGKFPFPALEVGQSFFVPCSSAVEKNAIRVSARYYGHKLRRKFITRSVENGVRVWRVEIPQLPPVADIEITNNFPVTENAPIDVREAVISTAYMSPEDPGLYYIVIDVKGAPPAEVGLPYDSPTFDAILRAAVARQEAPTRTLADIAGTRLMVTLDGLRPSALASGEPL